MLRTALYYPHLDIHDPDWLRSAILFWDGLQTIVPRAVRTPYKNSDTKILWKEGFLEPLRCDLHPELLDTLGKRVIQLMDTDSFSKFNRKLRRANDPNSSTLRYTNNVAESLNHQFRRAHIHPEKLSPELRNLAMRAGLARLHPEKLAPQARRLIDDIRLSNVHPDKISPHLRRFLQGTERFEDDDGEWLLMDSDFADIYLSALASLLAKETDIATLTNEEPAMAVNLRALLEDVSPATQPGKKGALVSFMMETIRIDPQTRIDRLLAFRRSREVQLAELSAQFDDISAKIGNCETAQELRRNVQDVYTTRVRPKLSALKNELRDNSIQSIWDGVQRAVTMTVPAGGALAYFTGLSGTILIAASAAITITDLAVKTHLARNKARRASPFTYLLDVERKFAQNIEV